MSARPARSAEQQVQEDLVRLEAYRAQLSSILQQHQLLVASRADHQRAREALEELDRPTVGDETLIPLGAEAWVRGRPDRAGPVLLGVGSGLVAEVPRERAVETLANRSKQIDEAGRELEGQIRQLEDRIRAVSQRIEALGARSRAPLSGDVGGG